MSHPTWNRYGTYLETPPEQIFEWHDAENGADGWLVIDSLRGGAAGGGGTRVTGRGRLDAEAAEIALEYR